MTRTRSLEQARAIRALAQVNQRRELQLLDQERYVSYAHSLPAEIAMNGLGQALAMQLAAAGGNVADPHRLLHDDLQAWLCDNEDLPSLPYQGRLLVAITRHDQHVYLLAQAEAMAFGGWLKRFAVAYLNNPKVPGQAT